MTNSPTRQETVLVVEDDATLRMSLRATLRSAGYRVALAATGTEGLELALSERPDLVLLDVMLPGMNGFEVCQQIRGHDADVPILMVTAKGQEEDKVRGLGLGADDYVVKPFGVAELLARVDAALRRQRAARAETRTLRLGDVAIDFVAHTMERNGEAIATTALELKLLWFLYQRRDRVLSRQQILDGVWGADYYGTERTVDNFINRLRAKLEAKPRRPRFIVTVRGAGYRFCCDDENGTEAGR